MLSAQHGKRLPDRGHRRHSAIVAAAAEGVDGALPGLVPGSGESVSDLDERDLLAARGDHNGLMGRRIYRRGRLEVIPLLDP